MIKRRKTMKKEEREKSKTRRGKESKCDKIKGKKKGKTEFRKKGEGKGRCRWRITVPAVHLISLQANYAANTPALINSFSRR